MKCERCATETISSICSMFNEQQICMPCKDKETSRPDYKKACDAEAEAVRRGDYNFKGIGLKKHK